MGYPSVLMGSIQDDIHTAALNSISCVSQAALIGSGLSKGYEDTQIKYSDVHQVCPMMKMGFDILFCRDGREGEGGLLMFKGSYVAMVTPFRDGKLDEEGIRSLVEFHVENGTHG